MSLGDWSENAPPTARQAFVSKVRVLIGQPQVMVHDADESPWDDLAILGPLLTREEALARPDKAQYFHVIDHVIAEDDRFMRYFHERPKPTGRRR